VGVSQVFESGLAGREMRGSSLPRLKATIGRWVSDQGAGATPHFVKSYCNTAMYHLCHSYTVRIMQALLIFL
jgi:hypothetical protein